MDLKKQRYDEATREMTRRYNSDFTRAANRAAKRMFKRMMATASISPGADEPSHLFADRLCGMIEDMRDAALRYGDKAGGADIGTLENYLRENRANYWSS